MEKKNILFVDDEVKILRGLRRMLYPLQSEWNMFFAESGQQALDCFEKHDIAVLISDMRMPHMNGFELLQVVRERYPDSIRVMLTGQPDRGLYSDAIEVSHYFLWKPAKLEDLQLLLRGFQNFDRLIHNDSLKNLIKGLSSLPTLPDLFHRLTELLDQPEVENKDIVAIISKDMAMTAQIFKLVNSVFFGISRRIDSLDEAIAYLGLDTIRNLVLIHHLFTPFSKEDVVKFKIDKIWQHSFSTALLAKMIASTMNNETPVKNNAYIAGLLHDIGKLVLIQHFPEQYMQILQKAEQESVNQVIIEQEYFGTDHAAIGGFLIKLWGLPSSIAEAVAMHHNKTTTDLSVLMPILESAYHANRITHGDYSQSSEFRQLGESLNRCDDL